jgi:hypothetical protein
MVAPFILRFEEPLAEAGQTAVPVTMGTRTETFTAREGSDSDPSLGTVLAIPTTLRVVAGTQTLTNVRAEASDTDPRSVSHLAIPT